MSSSSRPSLSVSSPRMLAALIVTTMAMLAPSLASAQTQPVPLELRSEALAIVQICRNDYDRICPGVVPGRGRVLACLQSHANELSAGCAQVLPRAQLLRDNAVGALPR